MLLKFQYKTTTLMVLIIILLNHYSPVYSGEPYRITKYTINNGGWKSSGGEFEIIGSIGQTVTATSSSMQWQLNSGFWPSNNILIDIIFKNGFEFILNVLSKLNHEELNESL